MSKPRDYLFREIPVRKAVLSLAIPTVISQLITLIYNIADTFFIGQMGDPKQVAAATISVPAFMMLTALSNLFGIGGASRVSRCLGQGDTEEARKSAAFSIWTAAIVSFVYGISLLYLNRFVLPLLGAKADTYDFCVQYLFWAVTVGAVPTTMNATLAHLVRTEGYSRQAGFGVALGGILNIFLDPIFIFVFKMEIAGAAIATMLSNVIAFGYFLWFLWTIRDKTNLTVMPKHFTVKGGIASDVILSGLPSFVMMLLSSISNSVLNNLLTAWSTEAMAGMGIAKKIDMIAFSVAQGMSQGVLPLVAYNFASGDRKRMKDSIRVTLTYSLIFAFCALICLYAFAGPATRLFIDDDTTVDYGKTFVRIICFVCPSTAVNFMVIAVFQATKQKGKGLLLSFLRKGSLDIPLMLAFNHFFGVTAIPWATPIADWCSLAVSMALLIPFLKKTRVYRYKEVPPCPLKSSAMTS